MPSGRRKGGKNRKWTPEEKLKVVKLNIDDHVGYGAITTEYGGSKSQIHKCVHYYLDEGFEGLKNKKKTGNNFSALHTSKTLTHEERLELENMKLKVENERLKKDT